MKIAVLGPGTRNTGHALTRAPMSQEVLGGDTHAAWIDRFASGTAPFYEHGPADVLQEVAGGRRFTLTGDPAGRAETEARSAGVGTAQSEAAGSPDFPLPLTALETLLPPLRSAGSRGTV